MNDLHQEITMIGFCLYYVVIGIMFERPFELCVLMLATITLWIYNVLNYAISVRSVFNLVRMVVSILQGIPMICLGVSICRRFLRFKELIFRTVGANADLHKMCNRAFIFIDLLKADFQVSVSMAILVMNKCRDLNLVDKILLTVALVVSAGSFAAGYCSVRFESLVSVVLYLILWSSLPYYDLYLIIHAALDLRDKIDDSKMEISLYVVMFVTSAISLTLRTTSLVFGIRVFMNFGRGLARKMFDETYEVMSGSDGAPSNIQGTLPTESA